MHCRSNSVVEEHYQIEPKILALVSHPPLLGFDNRFGLETTTPKRRSFVGSDWCRSNVFRQNAVFAHFGDSVAWVRDGMYRAKSVPALIPTGTMADRELVDVAERGGGRTKVLSSPSGFAWASSGWLVWTGVFPKPTKAPVFAFRSQRFHLRRYRRRVWVHWQRCSLDILYLARLLRALGHFSNHRRICIRLIGRDNGLGLVSGTLAHRCQHSPSAADGRAFAFRQRWRFCPLCHLNWDGSFAQCCVQPYSTAKAKATRGNKRCFG